jgi:RpiB/LacA/LacB family sugar-phosphate isomerase
VRVAIASDHGGFALKEDLKRLLDKMAVPYDDYGPATDVVVDYPEFAAAVAQAVRTGRADRGILICGTGIGMSIAANKVPGIRAALATSAEMARLGRAHNDANVITLGGRTTAPDQAREIVRLFLSTAFDGGRHQIRVAKIAQLESCSGSTRTTQS